METLSNIVAKPTIYEILLEKFVLKDKECMSAHTPTLRNPFIDTDYIIACDTICAILIPRKEFDQEAGKYRFSTIFTENIWKDTNNISGIVPATFSANEMLRDFATLPKTYITKDEHCHRIKIAYQNFDPFIISIYLLSVAELLQHDTIELIYQRPEISERRPCSIFKIGNIHICIAPMRKAKGDRIHFRYLQFLNKPNKEQE